jgi:uncharacterized HAD superfamily protein
MKIATDLDEIDFAFTDAYLPFYNKLHGTHFKKEDIHSYYFYEVFGISREYDTKVIDMFIETAEYRNMPLVKGAYEGIRELSKNNELYAITGRRIDKRKVTEDLVARHFDGCYKSIHFTDFKAETGHAIQKYEICKQLGIELMIEDLAEIAIEISQKCDIPVIMPDYPWNKNANLDGTNVTRVFGIWEGIMGDARKYI